MVLSGLPEQQFVRDWDLKQLNPPIPSRIEWGIEHPNPGAFLGIVDPFQSESCILYICECGSLCSKGKSFYSCERGRLCGNEKSLNTATCSSCHTTCPDPDCRGNGIKLPNKEMCGHCEKVFLRNLDWDASDEDDPVRRKREGFVVYELANDVRYIGMTYHPSQRQFQHRKRAEIEERSKSAQDPERYRRRANSNIEDDWKKLVQIHWDKQRTHRQTMELCRIKWLSPVLQTRDEAFRCEWALKHLRKGGSLIYSEAMEISSIPSRRFQETTNLYYHPKRGQFIFELAPDLPYHLGVNETSYALEPDKVLAPRHYELQTLDDGRVGSIVEINRSHKNVQVGRDAIAKKLRIRAVVVSDAFSSDSVAGPWTNFEISRVDAARTVQNCLGIKDLQAVEISRNCIQIDWNVTTKINDVLFEIERSIDGVDRTVFDAGESTQWLDVDFITKPYKITTFSYRLRAKLGDIVCDWIPEVFHICVDRTYLVPGDRVQNKKSKENGVVESLRKGKKLGTSMVRVKFDDQWIREVPADDLRILE